METPAGIERVWQGSPVACAVADAAQNAKMSRAKRDHAALRRDAMMPMSNRLDDRAPRCACRRVARAN